MRNGCGAMAWLSGRVLAVSVGSVLTGPAAVTAMVCCVPTLVAAGTINAGSARDSRSADAVAQALFAASVTREAEMRQRNEEDAQVRKKLDAIKGEVNRLQTRLGQSGQRSLAEQRKLRAALISEKERFLADLARRDRAFAREISALRDNVTSIAATPEGQSALQIYNNGDRVGALKALDELAEEQASTLQKDLQEKLAFNQRHIAMLALDALNQLTIDATADERISNSDVIARFKHVVSIDRGFQRGWVELAKLHQDSGRLDLAKEAGLSALEFAKDDAERAYAYVELGQIYLKMGDAAGALRAFNDSLSIWASKYAVDQTSVETRRELAFSRLKLGDVQVSRGDYISAHEHFKASLGENMQLAKVPGDGGSASKRDVFINLRRLGEVLLKLGKPVSAQNAFELALGITEELLKSKPRALRPKRDVATCLESLGVLAETQGRWQDAIDQLQESLKLRREVVKADPTSATWRAELAKGLDKLGNVLVQQGQVRDAQRLFDEGFRIRQALAALDSSSADVKNAVSVSLVKLGDLAFNAGDMAAARTYFEDSLRLRKTLKELDKTSEKRQRDVTVTLDRLGDTLLKQGDLPKAREYYQESLERREQIVRSIPASTVAQRDVSVSLLKLGALAQRQGELQQARDYYQRSLTMVRAQIQRDVQSATLKRDEWITMSGLCTLPESGVSWPQVVAKMEEMQASRMLTQSDEVHLMRARQAAASFAQR